LERVKKKKKRSGRTEKKGRWFIKREGQNEGTINSPAGFGGRTFGKAKKRRPASDVASSRHKTKFKTKILRR